MNNIQIFKNTEFGEVRTIEENGKVLFCGSDCAKALGYVNYRDALRRHCKGVVKRDGVSLTTNQYGVTTEQTVEMSFIPEGDIYRLITHSKLPAAEKFESWVFDEVLPSIRKHGMYAKDELLDNPDLLISIAQELKEERQRNKALAEDNLRMKPKELFADAVAASRTSILIGDLAKMLRQNSVDIGQKRLFTWMRENGYLIKQKGASWNMPTQKAMDKGLFEIKETTITHADGHISISKTVKVTGSGQVHFINKFLSA